MVAFCQIGRLGRKMTITPFSGSAFWLITSIFIAGLIIIPKSKVAIRARNCFMIAFSIGIIFLSINRYPVILLSTLFLLSILVYTAGKNILYSQRKKPKKTIISTVIIIIVILLCYFKYSIIQTSFNNWFALFSTTFEIVTTHGKSSHLFFIGVSYFSFKFIHFLIECHNKKINNLTFLTFINYILFFPSFFSGPINRYNSFAKSIAAETKLAENFLHGTKRIINGLFKKIVLGNFLFPYSIAALDLSTATQTDIAIGIYAYMFYIYFNFSGYTDMAIGCGKIVGIELPENFNYPFFKRNLQQFWANWHMSLTTWLVDYIYWPMARKFRNMEKLRKKPVTLSNICIIITFLVCGLWHGDGLNFFIWGAYHGIGLAILNGYTHFIKKHTSRKTKTYIHKSPIAYGISNFITFQYVAFGFMLFACDMERIQMIISIFFQP